MSYAAEYDRYHAGPDIDDGELMPLPEGAADRQQLLAQFRADMEHCEVETYTIEHWCEDNAYDGDVLAWLQAQ